MFLKIPIYYTTDENGVKEFDKEAMQKEFNAEVKKLEEQSYQSIENFLNKVGTKLNTEKFNTNSNYRKKISNDLAKEVVSKFGGND